MRDLNRTPTPVEVELKNISDMSFNEMREEIVQLRKQKASIANAKDRFARVANEMREIAKRIGLLANELMPEFAITRTHSNYSEQEDYLQDLLQKGSQVTREIIMKAFPDLEKWQASVLFDKLRKLPNIEVEGAGVRGDPMKVRMKR